MPMHTVSQGECLSGIARRYGLDDWRAVYDHPDNAGLRRDRPNPNVILPGDAVYVPDLQSGDAGAATGRRHRFRAKRRATRLRVRVRDGEGRALEGTYRLVVEGEAVEGAIGPGGLVEADVAPDAGRGELTVWAGDRAAGDHGRRWELLIGHLDPLGKTAGAQARLNNLGFDAGPVDGINGPRTRAAAEAFQSAHGLTVDGIVGPQTRMKLLEEHGC